MSAFSRWEAKLPVGNALVPGTLGSVLAGRSDAQAVLTFKIIIGPFPGSGTVLFTWAGLRPQALSKQEQEQQLLCHGSTLHQAQKPV